MSRNAFLSVYRTDRDPEFFDYVRRLHDLGFSLYGSHGTAKDIRDNTGLEATGLGINILGHRIATLLPEVIGGLIADDTPEQRAELAGLGYVWFDLFDGSLYPLSQAIQAKDATEKSVIEQTDIGGRTLLSAAAKGRRIVLTSVKQREPILAWIRQGEPNGQTVRLLLAHNAELAVANYSYASADYTAGLLVNTSIGGLTPSAQEVARQSDWHP
jgi:phosphoribosylaminoimidazolecarboxamide formyltransferase/IMP cyclohydrolase